MRPLAMLLLCVFAAGLAGCDRSASSEPRRAIAPEVAADSAAGTCGNTAGSLAPQAKGLTPVDGGSIVYDASQGLCWLADADLAGEPQVRAQVQLSSQNPDGSTPLINPDGTMDYETALNWVKALDRFNNGAGWLNHNNWQLPTTQVTDPTCSSSNAGNFGALCVGSALGALYSDGLGAVYPASVVPGLSDAVGPMRNVQPGLYWTGNSAGGTAGQYTFSFNTGDDGANTTAFNFLHVLPMTHDPLGQVAAGGSSCSVLPYVSGPGAGIAVFDSCTGLSWPADANLAASNHFGFNTTIVLDNNHSNPDVNHSAFPLTVPMIQPGGTVVFSAVDPCAAATAGHPCPPATSGWIVSMNNANFGGSHHWALPNAGDQHTPGDMDALFRDLRLQPGDTRLESQSAVGPFARLQPGFYWSCERNDDTSSQAPCDPALMPGANCPTAPNCPPFAFSFNFDDGFEGTDLLSKHFYVMVYYPAGGSH